MNEAEEVQNDLPMPNLTNFTSRHVRSLIDGSSISSTPVSSPGNIDEDMMDFSGLSQSDPTSNTSNNNAADGDVNSSPPSNLGGLRPAEVETIIRTYKTNLDQLRKQNNDLSAMIAEVNQQRATQAEQMEAVMSTNKQLLETLEKQNQGAPNVEDLTKMIKKDLVEDFNERIEAVRESHQKDLQSKENLYIADLKAKDEQYENMLQKALEKVRADNTAALARQQSDFLAQLEQLNKELDAAKRKPVPAPRSVNSINASKTTETGRASLGALRQQVFDYVPGTVKTDRGGALQNTTIDWPTLEPRPKHVTFATSTPRMPISNEEMEGLAAPLITAPPAEPIVDVSNKSESSTLMGLAAEFRKMREPKLQKLKGGNTTTANLFLTSWLSDVWSHIKDRELSESESIQLVREYTEGKARQQVDFYLDTTATPSLSSLLDHLTSVFTTGEDEATIKSEFYSRKQLARESEDDFADALQLLARKIILVQPTFRSEANSALVHQFANGLREDVTKALAKSLVLTKPGTDFIKFRTEVANISGSRTKRTSMKISTNLVDDSSEYQQPAKKQRTEQPDLDAQIRCLLEENRKMNKKIDDLASMQSQKAPEVFTQAIGGAPNRFGPRNTSTAPRFQGSNKQKDNPYLGKAEPPKPTNGKNGKLNIAETCNYCKNPGHLLDNCPKLQERIDKGLARPIHASQKQGN